MGAVWDFKYSVSCLGFGKQIWNLNIPFLIMVIWDSLRFKIHFFYGHNVTVALDLFNDVKGLKRRWNWNVAQNLNVNFSSHHSNAPLRILSSLRSLILALLSPPHFPCIHFPPCSSHNLDEFMWGALLVYLML